MYLLSHGHTLVLQSSIDCCFRSVPEILNSFVAAILVGLIHHAHVTKGYQLDVKLYSIHIQSSAQRQICLQKNPIIKNHNNKVFFITIFYKYKSYLTIR